MKANKKENSFYSTFGFYHIAAINNYKDIISDQVRKIFESQLYSQTEKIFVCVVGGKLNMNLPKKFKVMCQSPNLREFEYPTLIYMKKFCNTTKDNCFVWYIHTKNVTRPNELNQIPPYPYFKKNKMTFEQWRQNLESVIIQKHCECKKLLLPPYNADVSGYAIIPPRDQKSLKKLQQERIKLKLSKEEINVSNVIDKINRMHGNFWWSKSNYIKSLPEIKNMNRNNRYWCEAWIGMGKGRFLTLNDL